MYQYFLEHYPNLDAVQASLKICCDGKYVKFRGTSISTLADGDVSWKTSAFPSISTKTLCNLKICPLNELSVRFQVGLEPRDFQLNRFVVSAEENILDCDHQLVHSQVQFMCRFCRQIFLEQSFHRILPLPSSDWVDAIGDFFCHTHSHGHHHGNETTVEPNAPSITPQENDLLVGNGWIVLRPSSFRNILRKKGVNINTTVLKCSRCHTSIGKMESSTTTDCSCWLQLSKVAIATDVSGPAPSLITPVKSFIQHQLACSLLKMIEELQCYSYTIRRENDTATIGLRTLGALSSMYCNTQLPVMTRVFTGLDPAPSPQPTCVVALKVFFTNESNGDKMDGEVVDMGVEEWQLLQLVLMENHLSLPPSLRIAMSQKVSYLQVNSAL